MGDKIKELEAQMMSLSFMNEFLMDKLNIGTQEIQQFAEKCLENYDGDKNTDTYYFLLGAAYHEKAVNMIKELKKQK